MDLRHIVHPCSAFPFVHNSCWSLLMSTLRFILDDPCLLRYFFEVAVTTSWCKLDAVDLVCLSRVCRVFNEVTFQHGSDPPMRYACIHFDPRLPLNHMHSHIYLLCPPWVKDTTGWGRLIVSLVLVQSEGGRPNVVFSVPRMCGSILFQCNIIEFSIFHF